MPAPSSVAPSSVAPPRVASPPRLPPETLRAELRETRALLERTLDEQADLYECSPVGLVQFDAQGVIADLNPRAAALLDVRADRAAGLPFVHFVAPADHRRFHEHLHRCGRTHGGAVCCDLRLAAPAPDPASAGRAVQALTRRLRHGRDAFQTALVDVSELHVAQTRLRRAHDELLRRTQEAETRSARLARLHARVVRAEQAERDRLARHLHDHLQQFLVGARMQAHLAEVNVREGSLTPEELAVSLRRLAGLVDEALSSSRTLTSELSPPALLQELGLPASLHWLAEFYETRHGLRVEVAVGAGDGSGDGSGDGGEDESLPSVPQHLRVLLFEATRELLLNVVKYAGVSEAAIRLEAPDERTLRLTVRDAGEGFETGDLLERRDSASGLGLFGLSERLEDAGGAVSITSAPGLGVAVAVTVPVG